MTNIVEINGELKSAMERKNLIPFLLVHYVEVIANHMKAFTNSQMKFLIHFFQ